MPYQPTEEFQKFLADIASSGNSVKMTVRDLLRQFSQERRSYLVVDWIRHNLSKYGVETVPDFEQLYIDAETELRKVVKSTLSHNSVDQETRAWIDPVPRLERLESANRAPVSIHRDADVRHAITLMMMHDYSQLPVMQNERDVDGIISWRSIVAANTINSECIYVRDCMSREVEILSGDVPLFTAVRAVMDKEVVLVKGKDKRIVGLVTIADIGQQFISLAEPFLILEQIEKHIRHLLEGRFSLDQLKTVRNPSDNSREINAISDLTFGEYIRLLEIPGHWEILNVNMHRVAFTQLLEKIRNIRNDVMHFDPDGITPINLADLREANNFFYTLSQFKRKSA